MVVFVLMFRIVMLSRNWPSVLHLGQQSLSRGSEVLIRKVARHNPFPNNDYGDSITTSMSMNAVGDTGHEVIWVYPES